MLKLMKNVVSVIRAYNKRCSVYSRAQTGVYVIPIYKIPYFKINELCLLKDAEFVYQRLLSVTRNERSWKRMYYRKKERVQGYFAQCYILCNNFDSLNNTTKSIIFNNSFWWSFEEFNGLPLICESLNKRHEKMFTFQLATWRGQLCFRDNKVTLFNRNINLLPKNLLVWHCCYLSKWNSLLSFYQGHFLKWVLVLKRDSLA